MGETSTGKVASVRINTHGTMGGIGGGSVEIKEKSGKVLRSYELAKEDITQYYEGCRGVPTKDEGCHQANIGLSAFMDSGAGGMVQINFIGTDFQDVLEAYLLNSSRKPEKDNSMRVWKGEEGLDFENAYYTFKDIVCQMDHDV